MEPLDEAADFDTVRQYSQEIAAERNRHAATLGRLSHKLTEGCIVWKRAFVAHANHSHPCVRHFVEMLDSRALLVVPLQSEERPWGLILADNFVTYADGVSDLIQAAGPRVD